MNQNLQDSDYLPTFDASHTSYQVFPPNSLIQSVTTVQPPKTVSKNSLRQKMKIATETAEQKRDRLAKLAHRMRIYRLNEDPVKRKQRLELMAERARQRIRSETSEQRQIRLKKLNEYSRRKKERKKCGDDIVEAEIKQEYNPQTIQTGTITSFIEQYQHKLINAQSIPSYHTYNDNVYDWEEHRTIKPIKASSVRARLRRAKLAESETDEERRNRLDKQAEYARNRRFRVQTVYNRKEVEARARMLYAEIHGN